MIWVNLYCIVFAKVFSEEVSEIRSRDPPALRKAFPGGRLMHRHVCVWNLCGLAFAVSKALLIPAPCRET